MEKVAICASRMVRSVTRRRMTSDRRVMGILAHVDSGKTTLTENILFAAGRRSRVGRVDSGSTTTDFLAAERERGITIQSAAVRLEWAQKEIFLVDTPGHVDFGFEVERSLRVLDGVVVVVDAVAGAQARTAVVARLARKHKLPIIFVINKMDRVGADFERAMESVQKRCLGRDGVLVQIQTPRFHENNDFAGALELNGKGFDENDEDIECKSESLRSKAAEALADVDEEIAELFLNEKDIDFDMLKSHLRTATLELKASPVLCAAALKGIGVRAVLDAIVDFLPAPRALDSLHGGARALAFKVTHDSHRGPLVFLRIYDGELSPKTPLYGLSPRDNVVSPERPTALMRPFADDLEPLGNDEVATRGEIVVAVGLKKTVAGDTIVDEVAATNLLKKNKKNDNDDDFAQLLILKEGMVPSPPVYSLTVEPMRASDFDNLKVALGVMTRDDPSLVVHLETDDESTISGMGELHLDVAKDRLRRDFKIDAAFGPPRVELRESVDETAAHDDFFVYDKTIGTRHLLYSLKLEVKHTQEQKMAKAPTVRVDSLAAEKLRKAKDPNMRDSLVAGLLSSRGPLEGHPLTDLDIFVKDVSFDNDATAGAARACAAQALRDVLSRASPVILEPIMRLDLTIADSRLGDVLADIALKRGASVLGATSLSDDQDQDPKTHVEAIVPLAEILGYASAVRSLTAGEADFSTHYSHHAIQQKQGGKVS